MKKEKKTISNESFKPKRHTIRKDAKGRWKAGNLIHFVINNRTPKRFLFAPVVKCKSVQEISIIHEDGWVSVYIDNQLFYCSMNNKPNNKMFKQMGKLAVNDGFETILYFFAYFNKDFNGKLIHWTNLKY